jgi:hypothetical protein
VIYKRIVVRRCLYGHGIRRVKGKEPSKIKTLIHPGSPGITEILMALQRAFKLELGKRFRVWL